MRSLVFSVAGALDLVTGLRRLSGLRAMDAQLSDKEERLHLETFLSACSNSEPVGFYALTRLFDKTKRTPILERAFTPHYLCEYLETSGPQKKCGEEKLR